jgi:glucose-6-phosphate isomerase
MTIGTVITGATGRLTEQPAWKALEAHHRNIRAVHLRELFARDPGRGERLTAEAAGVYLDYSKNRIADETLPLLVSLAEESGLRARIDAMFRGEKINVSEKRAVLHVALRAPRGTSILVDGENVVPEVHAVLDRMADFANRVRSGIWNGHTGKPIRNVVNIGIGGSDLGPRQLDERAYPAVPENPGDEGMTIGYDKPLYVLPFDGQRTFARFHRLRRSSSCSSE